MERRCLVAAGRRGGGRAGRGAAGARREGRRDAGAQQHQAADQRAKGAYLQDNNLFRRPAGLADGLALKEPALLTDHRGIRPNNLGPPFPDIRVRDSAFGGTLAKCKDACSDTRHELCCSRQVAVLAPTSPGSVRRRMRFGPPSTRRRDSFPPWPVGTRRAACSRAAARPRRGRHGSAGGGPAARRLAPGRRRGRRERRDQEHDAPRRRRSRRSTLRRWRAPSTRASRPATRPQAVVIVDERDWPAALAASALASAPLDAPILYAEGDTLPQVSREGAARRCARRGAPALGGAQVIRDRHQRAAPGRLLARARSPPREPAATAAAIERVLAHAHGGRAPRAGDRGRRRRARARCRCRRRASPPRAARRSCSPTPAALAAGDGDAAARPAPPRDLRDRRRARSARSALGELAKLGRVTRIPGADAAKATTPATALDRGRPLHRRHVRLGRQRTGPRARVRELRAPARRARRGAALGDRRLRPAAAARNARRRSRRRSPPTSATSSRPTPRRPNSSPVRGVYNHGWLIGDEPAISLTTQAELDSLLEISPRKQGAAEEASGAQAE